MLEGVIDSSRLYQHRFNKKQIVAGPPEQSVHLLRVMLDPVKAEGIELHVAWAFTDGGRTGLHVRNCIACPTDGTGATATISGERSSWADVLTGAATLSGALEGGSLRVEGDAAMVRQALACFEVGGLQQ